MADGVALDFVPSTSPFRDFVRQISSLLSPLNATSRLLQTLNTKAQLLVILGDSDYSTDQRAAAASQLSTLVVRTTVVWMGSVKVQPSFVFTLPRSPSAGSLKPNDTLAELLNLRIKTFFLSCILYDGKRRKESLCRGN